MSAFYQGCHHEETSDFGSESDPTLTRHCATFSPVTPIFYCISAVYMSQRTFVQNLRKIYLIFLPRPRYLKSLRLFSNSTHRTTRSQTFHTLCIPLFIFDPVHSPPPLYTSALLWNNLPSDLRSPDLSFPLFSCTFLKYLGYPVSRP